jgi:hypothetical protein
MSKKRPSQIEERWRRHHRQVRLLANFHDELWHDGNPLDIVRRMQRNGSIAVLETVAQAESKFFARQPSQLNRRGTGRGGGISAAMKHATRNDGEA